MWKQANPQGCQMDCCSIVIAAAQNWVSASFCLIPCIERFHTNIEASPMPLFNLYASILSIYCFSLIIIENTWFSLFYRPYSFQHCKLSLPERQESFRNMHFCILRKDFMQTFLFRKNSTYFSWIRSIYKCTIATDAFLHHVRSDAPQLFEYRFLVRKNAYK